MRLGKDYKLKLINPEFTKHKIRVIRQVELKGLNVDRKFNGLLSDYHFSRWSYYRDHETYELKRDKLSKQGAKVAKYYNPQGIIYRADLGFYSKMKLVIVNRKTGEVVQGNPDPESYESHLIRA